MITMSLRRRSFGDSSTISLSLWGRRFGDRSKILSVYAQFSGGDVLKVSTSHRRFNSGWCSCGTYDNVVTLLVRYVVRILDWERNASFILILVAKR